MAESSRDARLDAEIEEWTLREVGLIEPDQPTAISHARYVERMEAEFTPIERRIIRAMVLGESAGSENPERL